MGLYAEQVVPRLVDLTLGGPAMGRWRSKATAGLTGTVVEVGFGSGSNLEYYPAEVKQIYAVEPSRLARRRARARIERSPAPVELVGLDGQSIPLPDESCDGALSTFVLCTVPDPGLVLAEVHRVLRPGGEFHYLEHGLAPDGSVERWQHRLEPVQRRIADGCHLTRDATRLVRNAGFQIRDKQARYVKGPKPFSYFTLGVASKA